jgi:hypothetical protein
LQTVPVPDVLAVLRPPDLSALEMALQQFLERLGHAAPHTAEGGDGTGLYPWVVAWTAAAAACEIARRQLRRPAPAGPEVLPGFDRPTRPSNAG